MRLAKLPDRCANRGNVALEEGVVQSRQRRTYFRFFFAGAFGPACAVDFVVAVEVLTPPSPSERLSSTSVVCVIASVPFCAGCAFAGAIVSVFVSEAFECERMRLQPAATNAAAIIRKANVFTRTTAAVSCNFPDRIRYNSAAHGEPQADWNLRVGRRGTEVAEHRRLRAQSRGRGQLVDALSRLRPVQLPRRRSRVRLRNISPLV